MNGVHFICIVNFKFYVQWEFLTEKKEKKKK
jgi:hypothetical protein